MAAALANDQPLDIVLEIFKYPDKDLPALLMELKVHFEAEPYRAQIIGDPVHDELARCFRVRFRTQDAERVLRFPRQYLLGNQDDIIELQRHKQYQDSILIRSECDIPSTEALKYIFNKKFGPVLYCSRYRNRRDIFVLKFGYENAIASAVSAVNSIRVLVHQGLSVSVEQFTENLARPESLDLEMNVSYVNNEAEPALFGAIESSSSSSPEGGQEPYSRQADISTSSHPDDSYDPNEMLD